MKSILRVVSIAAGISAFTIYAADKRAQQLAELSTVRAELKPLREKAYLEPEVIAARKVLDDAYKVYWDAVRTAMVRLDPSQKALVEKDIALRKEIGPIQGGSRAEDYAKKAAVQTAAIPADKP